jgi:hypothetical protein
VEKAVKIYYPVQETTEQNFNWDYLCNLIGLCYVKILHFDISKFEGLQELQYIKNQFQD